MHCCVRRCGMTYAIHVCLGLLVLGGLIAVLVVIVQKQSNGESCYQRMYANAHVSVRDCSVVTCGLRLHSGTLGWCNKPRRRRGSSEEWAGSDLLHFARVTSSENELPPHLRRMTEEKPVDGLSDQQ